MKIGYIARGLTKGGVTRYIDNFLKTFDSDFSSEHSLVLFTDKEEYKTTFKNIKVVYIKKSNKILWDYLKILPLINKEKLDAVIYPKNIIPFTHIFFPFKKINVIHDLAYFDKNLGEYKFFDTIYMKAFMKLSCIIANKVIAVSNSTKNDIVSILKITPNKISVVYEAVESNFKKVQDQQKIDEVLNKFSMKKPFIFYCGSLSPRKNILTALKAFNEIKNEIPHNFYLSGGQSWKDANVVAYIEKELSDRVFRIGYLSEEELVVIYSAADLFAYPSLYEGFGLPILEAQACGCPVITSNLTSCPEIAGNGAMIINPSDSKSFSDSMLSILKDNNVKENLITSGLENIKKFSWNLCVKKVSEIL